MSNQEQPTPDQGEHFRLDEEITRKKVPARYLLIATVIVLIPFVMFIRSLIIVETSPGNLLSQMIFSDQVNACERTMDEEEDDDYWVVDTFEDIVSEYSSTQSGPAITYAPTGVHEDNYYTDSLGKSDYQNNVAATDIQSACVALYEKDIDFAKAIDRVVKRKAAEAAAYEKKKAEEKAKIQPLLDKWNKKAIDAGSGDIREYLEAESAAEYEIKSGASYSFTGATANISGVSCYATTRSNWVGGKPGGWWSCIIQTLGGGFNSYSIEFSGSSWGGKPDNGQMAGADLSWRIPDELMDWLNSSS